MHSTAQYARLCEEYELYQKELEKLQHIIRDTQIKIKENKLKEVPSAVEHSKLLKRLAKRLEELEVAKTTIENSSVATSGIKKRIAALEEEKKMLESYVKDWGRVYEFKTNQG